MLEINRRQLCPRFSAFWDPLCEGDNTEEDWEELQTRSRTSIPNTLQNKKPQIDLSSYATAHTQHVFVVPAQWKLSTVVIDFWF